MQTGTQTIPQPDGGLARVPVWGGPQPEYHWLNDRVLTRAMRWTLANHVGSGRVPEPKVFLDYARLCKRDIDAEETKALPPPAEPPRRAFDAAQRDRHVAIGKARMRKRYQLMDEWKAANGIPLRAAVPVPRSVWRGAAEDERPLDDPTEEEVDAVLREMAAHGEPKLRGPLAAALAVRVPHTPGLANEPVAQHSTRPEWPVTR